MTRPCRSLILVTLTSLLLLSGCSAPAAAPPPTVTNLAKSVEDTTLGPGDIFSVTVFGEKDLTGKFLVSAQGTVDYPLIGRIKVQGKTPPSVGELITTKLAQGYLKTPHVSVFVNEYNSKKISVFGQVKKPGTFNYVNNMSIVEAITLAGGFTPMASKNKITVTRITDGKSTRFTIPVEDIGEGKAANYLMRPGDIVFIPERVF
jgi:protein involved in polysaccharide export with SLBB domain